MDDIKKTKEDNFLEETKEEKEARKAKEAQKALDNHIDDVGEYLSAPDIAYHLRKLKKHNEDIYEEYLHKLDTEDLAQATFDMPNHMLKDMLDVIPRDRMVELIEELESDDQLELLEDLSQIDKEEAKKIFDELDDDDKEDILRLSSYEDDEAGAYMQLELFSARLDEQVSIAVDRLRDMRHSGELGVAYQLFAVDEKGHLKYAINLSDLILYNFSLTVEEVVKSSPEYDDFAPITVNDKDKISDVARIFGDYNLSVVPVVDSRGVLVGRITPDDIHDFMTESATEQIYNLAGVDDEVEYESESLIEVGRSRAVWLGVNLVTAFLASFVIGFFGATIEAYVALAVLMPIVSSMGGNVGMQSLTVTVRRLALGDINFEHTKEVIKKECSVALMNGAIFALLVALVSLVWFKSYMLGVVIAIAMVVNLMLAGLFGAVIPLMLKKFGVDPAVGSSVVLTALTDMIGFFAFLGLATIILL